MLNAPLHHAAGRVPPVAPFSPVEGDRAARAADSLAVVRPAAPAGDRLHVAYLMNQYPKVSHSFIRREIAALEQLGVAVERIALRGWDAQVLDKDDVAERAQTRYVLKAGAGALLAALAYWAVVAPRRLLAALTLVRRMGGQGASRPNWVHWIYLLEACRVARWLQRSPAMHLHAHFGTNAAEVAMLAARLQQVPYSFTVHGPEEFDQPLGLRIGEKSRHAAFVVAISSFGRSQLYRWLDPALWPKVQVVHCGVDAGFFAAPVPPPAHLPQLVCVGRLCEQKGQLLLLRAVRCVIDAGREVQLVLAGDGEMRPQIEALVQHLSLQRHVRITGWLTQAQVCDEILQARALVLPSFAEGLPVVLMEAMALGRPVLASHIAGIPELVLDQECGWLFPAGDVDRLAQAIQACLDADDATLAAMGEAARRRCAARHAVLPQAGLLAALMHPANRVGP